MPIEHEKKYVLNTMPLFEKNLRHDLARYDGTVHEIQQAYIGAEGRIRKKVLTHRAGHKLSKHERKQKCELIFTYKHKLSQRNGALELEMPMTPDDFKLAWEEEKNAHLVKTRITLHMPWKEVWEIDFFKQGSYTYLLLAECELAAGRHDPIRIPDFIKEHLIYEVPENDSRFKNRNLTDADKVTRLIDIILVESQRGKIAQQPEAIPLQRILP